MKKMILLLSIIALGFTMSSCLDMGENSFSGQSDFSMIATDNQGLVYAKIFNNGGGGLITSPEISKLRPGQFAFISFNWKESNGVSTTAENFQVYKVTTGSQIDLIPQTTLRPTDAPEDNKLSLMLGIPTYDKGVYFNDHWLFPYSYSKKEGESYRLAFYKSSETSTTNPDEILIDVRLEKASSGDNIGKKSEGYIVVDLSQLRTHHATSTGAVPTNLQIKFRYYREGVEEPHVTPVYTMTVYK